MVPIAVGAGVINDLVKYAAYRKGLPFMSVATAASMDGYASGGAPLSKNGFKHTIACAPPRVIVADSHILATAPAPMAGWGYGDLAGKIPAGADWIIADALRVEAMDHDVWSLVHDHLGDWLSDPAGIAKGDSQTLVELHKGLTICGLSMEFHGSTRPASGADQQIAHIWEMQASPRQYASVARRLRGDWRSPYSRSMIGCLQRRRFRLISPDWWQTGRRG